MRPVTRREESRSHRLAGYFIALALWIIPTAAELLNDEPEWTWTQYIVTLCIFTVGWMGSFGVPMVMHLYDIGTTPLRIAIGAGIYVFAGVLCLWHEHAIHAQ